MYGLKYLSLLAANGLASIARYTPGGPNRNCGDRGISPKSVLRRQRHVAS